MLFVYIYLAVFGGFFTCARIILLKHLGKRRRIVEGPHFGVNEVALVSPWSCHSLFARYGHR